MSSDLKQIDDPCLSKYTKENSQKERSKQPTKNTITKAIQLIFYHEKERKERKFLIFVEGEKDDLIFYSPVFNLELCVVIPFGGIDHVKYLFKKRPHVGREITEQLKEVLATDEGKIAFNKLFTMRDQNKVIGIVDLDFENEKNINNRYSPNYYCNLFVTETNDTQTLLLTHNGLLIFIHKLCEKKEIEKFRERRNLQPLYHLIILMTNYSGLARHIDHKLKNKGISDYQALSFTSLKPQNVFDEFINNEKLLTPDNIRYLLFEKDNGNRSSIYFDREYKNALSNLDKDFRNKWEICQGHDMMRVLLSIHQLVGCNGDYKCEENILEAISNIFHERKYFRQSPLYSALKKWESEDFPFPEQEMFSEIYSSINKKVES